MYRVNLMLLFLISFSLSAFAEAPAPGFQFEQGLDVRMDGTTWLRTVATPFDPAVPDAHYKVYTHVYDWAGAAPITKGLGGKYPHHRGMFIGWSKTRVGDRELDSWSMRAGREGPDKDKYSWQQLVDWTRLEANADHAVQSMRIQWGGDGLDPYIEEERTLRVSRGDADLRVIDFISTLTALKEPVQLRGDPQHAGMHIRMDNEVVDHESTTTYVFPEGARVTPNETAEAAWWVCCAMDVRGARYWVLHMTSPKLVTGVPVYSIRNYARFGAFFEPDLAPGQPLRLAFRIIVANAPLDRDQCAALYAAYAAKENAQP